MGTQTQLVSFDVAIKHARMGKSVLLGNGFSIARGGGEFDYSSLLEKAGLEPNDPVRRLFSSLNTSDFEIVVRSLEHAAHVEEVYGDFEKEARFRQDAASLRDRLVETIHAVHPGVRFEIPDDQCRTCATFLNQYDRIFTSNYDLLLYWVILRNGKGFADGFGSGDTVGGFRTFSSNAACNTYYLHGALHLFLDHRRNALKRVQTGTTLIDDIAETIRANKQLPLIVAEGTSDQKISKIRSVPYLAFCHEQLKHIVGSLVIFGLGVSDNDTHIYDALCEADKLKYVIYCVHEPQKNLQKSREWLARYAERRRDIDWAYVDAASVTIWS